MFFAKKNEITSKVYNWLKKYTFELHKTELGGIQYITRRAKDKLENSLTDYLTQLNGDPLLFDPLIQEIKTAFSKELDSRTKAIKVFRRELLFKQLYLENYTNSLELQADNQKGKTERDIDKVRREFSRNLQTLSLKTHV
jgi:hypothetical protein